MTSSIPYTFTPGTRARAQEVNSNFAAVLGYVDNKINRDFSNLSEDGLIFLKENTPSPRNIGEFVFSSIPLSDSGLHLADGALLNGTGIYSEFVEYIANLYIDNPNANYFTDEETWQATVTMSATGSCGKFVYNALNNTVRLPKINGILQSTTDLSELGDLIEAGLPVHTHTRGSMNITGTVTNVRSQNGGPHAYTGAFYDTGERGERDQANGGSEPNQIGFDASRNWTGNTSDPVYENSDIQDTSTVQPEATRVFVYVVISNSSKTEIQVDIDEVVTDLNGKADKDLSNITASADVANKSLSNINDSAKISISNFAMPSSISVDLAIGSNGTNYTAPSNGYFRFNFQTNTGTNFQYGLTNITAQDLSSLQRIDAMGVVGSVFVPARKNDVVKITYESALMSGNLKFIYAQGSESEAV